MKNLPKLDEHLCFALYSASRAMTGAYREFLKALDITYPQYLVLLTLWELDGESVSRIGKRLSLDSATLTPLLKRLEVRGLLERRRSERDERVVELFLTREGKRLERRAADALDSVFCKAGLSHIEVGTLRDSLHALLRNLHAAEERQAG